MPLTAEEYGKSVDPPVSRERVHQWIKRGLPHVHGGGRNGKGIQIDKAEADAWLAINVPRGMPQGGTRAGAGRKAGKKSFYRRDAEDAEEGKGEGIKASSHRGIKGRAPKQQMKMGSKAALEMAASMTDEDAAEFLESIAAEQGGEVDAMAAAGAMDIGRMARMGLQHLMCWKTAEQIMALKIEREKIEARLLEVEDVRKTWGALVIALRRDLDRMVKVVTTKLTQQAGLPKTKIEAARSIVQDAVDQACLRISAGAAGDEAEVGAGE